LKCRETALSRYNLPLQAGRYRELYEELLATDKKGRQERQTVFFAGDLPAGKGGLRL